MENIRDYSNIKNLKEIEIIKKFDLDLKFWNGYEVDNYGNVVTLKLSSDKLTDLSLIKELQNLEFINIQHNKISELSNLINLYKLKKLYLADNNLFDLSKLIELPQLIELGLGRNKVTNIFPLSKLSDLTILGLSNNYISDISPIQFLKKLKRLDLRSNPIYILPEWITEFPNMDIQWKETYDEGFITFYNNPIKNVPIEIIKQGKSAIKAFFEEQKKTKSIPNPYVKLIFTGNSSVGKTSFINFLTNQTFKEGEITTHGIIQTTWKPTNTNLEINLWDFGGQEYYHSTHQLFFSNNALYLLMFDKQHNCNGWLQTEIDYTDKGKVTEELEHFDYFYWLRNIRNLSDKSKILMLQNKVENSKDKVYPSNEIFDENLEYKVEDYQTISVLNAFNYFKENHKFSYEFEVLQKLIINKLNEVKRGEIFEYYLKSKELIETAAQTKPVVSIAEFIEICKQANENIDKVITDKDGNETEYTAWKLMCVYFHETGVLLYYPDSPTLKEKIFIRPTFVTDTIYKVLNYKVKQDFGRFTFDDTLQSLKNDTVLAHDIIELMSEQNFKLIFEYPKNSNEYIAPQYLNDNKPTTNLLKNLEKFLETGFVLEFIQFLPKYILTEFMVNYGCFHKDNEIWKYGIVFEKYGTTAFVECKFEKRMIIYKSDQNGEHERLKYEVFETIRNINKNDKNLKLGLDQQNTYELDLVLRDSLLEKFKLFRIGYEEYKKELEVTIEKMLDKKFFLQNELLLVIDPNIKYSLQNQIKELENQIAAEKQKIANNIS